MKNLSAGLLGDDNPGVPDATPSTSPEDHVADFHGASAEMGELAAVATADSDVAATPSESAETVVVATPEVREVVHVAEPMTEVSSPSVESVVHEEVPAKVEVVVDPLFVPPVVPVNPPAAHPAPEPVAVPRTYKKPGVVRSLLGNVVFWLTVLIPSIVSIVYFGFIASDIYISESRFVVRMPQRPQQPSLVGALLQGSSFMRSQDDTFTVHDFVLSRDALRELDQRLGLRAAFSGEGVDAFSRFGGGGGDTSFESLYRYYGKRVSVEHDATTSITVLKSSAFTSEQAFEINQSLLQMSEALVNKINNRGRDDLIRYASTEVTDAEKRARTAAIALAGFRNQRAVFDPERQSTLQLQQIGKLQDEIIATRTQLVQLRALSPENPQISSLVRREQSLQKEMAAETARVAGDSSNSLTSKATEYERLSLERAFADRQLASAMASLEAARNEARRQQLYLERVVQPNKPDYALEPRRLRSILSTIALGLIAWGVITMLLAGLREHQD